MLEILISSSVLIVVLALLRLVLRGRISARLQYALWALVLVRLLVPVSFFESKVSVSAVAEPISAQVQEYSAQRVQTVYIPVDMGEHPETGEPMEAVGRTYVEPLDVARWVWYGGMGVAVLWFLLVNLRMDRRLKKDRVYYGAHGSVPVYITPSSPTPCLFGLFRPAIYLTEQAASDEAQAAQILAHEYSHLCHGDLFWALLRSLCLVVYWFDPFVWLAAALSRRDCELACDEAAIRQLGEEQRFDYGRTLLSLATVKLRPGDLLCGATTMTGGKSSLRERVERIARTKKLSAGLCALALVISALAVGCTFSGADSDTVAPTPAPTITPEPIPVTTDVALLGEGYEGYEVLPFEPDSAAGSYSQSSTITGNLSEIIQTTDGAAAAFMQYENYLQDFFRDDPTRWLTWLRFENEEQEQMARDNYVPLTAATILSMEKINDKLWAFMSEVQTYPDVPPQRIFNFLAADESEHYIIRNVNSIPEELSENLDPSRYDPQLLLDDGMVALGGPNPDQIAIQATLIDFVNPPAVLIRSGDSYVSDGTSFADMTFEDLLYSTDSWQMDTSPQTDPGFSDTYIALLDGKGGQLVIDAGRDEIRFYPHTQYYASYSIPGVSGSFYYDSLLAWASTLPQMDEDPEPVYMQFLTLALTTDYQGRYSRLSAAGPSAAAYEAFYQDFEGLCDTDFYYTMMLNREIYKLDHLAIERGYHLSPLFFYMGEPIPYENGDLQYDFTALLQVTTDEGLSGSGTISGYILIRDNLVCGFQITGGSVLNADPADDTLPADGPYLEDQPPKAGEALAAAISESYNASVFWNFATSYYSATHDENPDLSLAYVYTTDEDAYCSSYQPTPESYGLFALEEINENLFSYMLYGTMDDPVIYFFAGRVNGELKIYLSAEDIPAVISQGLNPEKYQETDPHKIQDENILTGIVIGSLKQG